MVSRICCTSLICLEIAAAATAQGTRIVFGEKETRTFASDECSYTLPGKDWEWGDPPAIQATGAKGLVSAKAQTGTTFSLIVGYEDFERDPSAYARLEDALMAFLAMKRVGSQAISQKGVKGYQIEVESTAARRGGSITVLFANDRAYCLAVVAPQGSPNAQETEVAVAKFEFMGTPRAMKPPREPETPSRPFLGVGGTIAGLSGAAFVLLLGICIWAVIRIRSNI